MQVFVALAIFSPSVYGTTMKIKTRRRGRPSRALVFTNRGAQLLHKKAGDNRRQFAKSIGISSEMLNHLVHCRRRPGLELANLLERCAGIPTKAWFLKPRPQRVPRAQAA